jgi:hypothetical protein
VKSLRFVASLSLLLSPLGKRVKKKFAFFASTSDVDCSDAEQRGHDRNATPGFLTDHLFDILRTSESTTCFMYVRVISRQMM